MKVKILSCICIVICISFFVNIADGQQDTAISNNRDKAIKVFIDCNYCDESNIKQEFTFLNYVREVKEADVFILVTYQNTGSGGDEYTFFFNGQKKFLGMNDTLVYASAPDATSDMKRQGQKQMLKMGLMRYIAKSPLFNEFEISYKHSEKQEIVGDKWKSWVFDISLNLFKRRKII